MTRLVKTLLAATLTMGVLAACSKEEEKVNTKPKEETKVENETGKTEEKTEEVSKEESSEQTTELKEGDFLVEEVMSLPLGFQVSKEEFDPNGFLQYEDLSKKKDESIKKFEGEGQMLSGGGSFFYHANESQYGDPTYKQTNLLETFAYDRHINNGAEGEQVRRYDLSHGTITPEGVEKAIDRKWSIELAIHRDKNTLELKGNTDIKKEVNDLELKGVNLYQNQLILVYTNRDLDTFNLFEAKKMVVVQREIKRDGSLGKETTVADITPNGFAPDKIIPTSKGLAAYQLTGKLVLLDGSNKLYSYKDLVAQDDSLIFFDVEKEVALYLEDNLLRMHNLRDDAAVEFNGEINNIGYKTIAYGGCDTKNQQHFLLGVEDLNGLNIVSAHMLDKDLAEVGDIYSINTNTTFTNVTEDGIILWSTNEDMEPPRYTASKIPFLGTVVSPDDFTIKE